MTGQPLVVRAIIARIHGPIASLFGVPAQRQFDQFVGAGAMQVGSRVISRADDKIDLRFQNIHPFPVKSDLILPLEIFFVSLDHLVKRVGGGMIISVLVGIVLNRVFRPGTEKGPGHAGAAIGLRDARMAA